MPPNPIVHHPKKVLVTGVSGFIGSNLVRVLLGQKYKVVGDLKDIELLRHAVRGCDTVYHLAAIFDYWLPEPSEMFVVNVEGTVNLMVAARDAGVQSVREKSPASFRRGCATFSTGTFISIFRRLGRSWGTNRAPTKTRPSTGERS